MEGTNPIDNIIQELDRKEIHPIILDEDE